MPFTALPGVFTQLTMLRVEADDAIVHVRLHRPEKRNAIDLALVREIETAFLHLPSSARVVVISGEGKHFCAGLDLSELVERSIPESIQLSRAWYTAFDAVQNCSVPVIAALRGAVVGGGLELAATAHLRVAESSAFYALPEGQHGIFVGGSGSVRIPRLIGVARMTDMMLTGRVFDATEGHAAGISNYLVGVGEGLPTALALAEKIAGNAPLSNFAVTQALPRIAEMAPQEGLFVEALMTAVAQDAPEAKTRLRDFLEKRGRKVEKI
jgi:enoyl-CoA hydratase/carnithine racemase